MRTSAVLPALAMSLSLSSLACQPAAPTGVRVSIGMNGFADMIGTLRITISVQGGFKGMGAAPARLGLTSMYTPDGLQMNFTSPGQQLSDASPLEFRLETDNQKDLIVTARAVAFNSANNKIASAAPNMETIPAGGEVRLPLTLQADPDGTTIDDTKIDLANAIVDRKIVAPAADVAPATVAVCKFGLKDGAVVLGFPTASPNPASPNTGEVFVVYGDSGTVDLMAPGNGEQVHFFGANSGDQLGAAIACLDLDNDSIDELIVGAPGAYNGNQQGAGRVYVFKGGTSLKTRPFNLGGDQVDLEWMGAAGNAGLGTRIVAANMQSNHPALLISAPGEGSGMVHLVNVTTFAAATAPVTPQVLGGTAGHVTFSGVKAQAIAVGDFDGDGNTEGESDVAIGDPTYQEPTNPFAILGAVYLFRNVAPAATTAFSIGGGGATGPTRVLLGNADKQSFGAALLAIEVTSAYPDLIVGAPGDNGGRGEALVYAHDDMLLKNGLTPGYLMPKWTFTGVAGGEHFGATLASGHLGTDTTAPLVVGSPSADGTNGRTAAGAVRAYQRFSNYSMPVLAQGYFGAKAEEGLGTAIAAGPIGGADTVSDLVMLAPGLGDGVTPIGSAYVRLTKP